MSDTYIRVILVYMSILSNYESYGYGEITSYVYDFPMKTGSLLRW
jgi:hypothetical protein